MVGHCVSVCMRARDCLTACLYECLSVWLMNVWMMNVCVRARRRVGHHFHTYLKVFKRTDRTHVTIGS